MSSSTAVERFQQSIAPYRKHQPNLLIDVHPDFPQQYLLTNAGDIPHHIAHIFSVWAEHQIRGDFIAFAWDGLGLDHQHRLLGGETYLVQNDEIHHLHSLQSIPLIGGEQAIKEPRRIALCLLPDKQQAKQWFNESELKIIDQMISQQINTPLCSSMGRLFDGVACLLGGPTTITYEAQASLYLEALARKSQCHSAYPVQ